MKNKKQGEACAVLCCAVVYEQAQKMSYELASFGCILLRIGLKLCITSVFTVIRNDVMLIKLIALTSIPFFGDISCDASNNSTQYYLRYIDF